MSNIFSSMFKNGANGVIEAFSSLPYHADKQTIGRAANWTTAQACRIVGSLVPTKYKNTDFSGFFRKAILATLGSFGSTETRNIDTLRSRVWLTKPFEFLRASVIESSRKAFDSSSQNFHAEFEVNEIVRKICDTAERTIQVPKKVQSANPRSILETRINPLIKEGVSVKPLTMAEAASKITAAVLPEVAEQSLRIFIVSAFYSYLTNSPYLSTMGTALFLTATASTFANSRASVQISTSSIAALSAMYWYGGSQWLSTILSISTLGLWWGCLANQKTKKLAEYKPPEGVGRISKLVEQRKGGILDVIAEVLEPTKGTKEFEGELKKIEFSAYPFTPFVDKPSTSVDQKRVRHNEPAKDEAPKKPSYADAEELRKQYASKHRKFEEKIEYWQLVDKEYVAKANYFRDQEDWNKYVTCIKNIVTARLTSLGMGSNVEAFNQAKNELSALITKKLKESPFNREKDLHRRLTGILEEIRRAKHSDDV